MDSVYAPALPDPHMEAIQGLGKLLYQKEYSVPELVKWDTVAWKRDCVQPGKIEVLKGMEKVQTEYKYSSLSLGTRSVQQLKLPCSINPRACRRL